MLRKYHIIFENLFLNMILFVQDQGFETQDHIFFKIFILFHTFFIFESIVLAFSKYLYLPYIELIRLFGLKVFLDFLIYTFINILFILDIILAFLSYCHLNIQDLLQVLFELQKYDYFPLSIIIQVLCNFFCKKFLMSARLNILNLEICCKKPLSFIYKTNYFL